jgi:hypothetical protein
MAGIVVVAAAAFILFPRGSHKPTTENEPVTPSATPSTTPLPSAIPVDTTQVPGSAQPPPDMDLPATPASASAVDAGKRLGWPTGTGPKPAVAEVDAGPAKPKVNPAWSILTHPPPGDATENVTPPAPAPAPEPKPE